MSGKRSCPYGCGATIAWNKLSDHVTPEECPVVRARRADDQTEQTQLEVVVE